jgi:hypothetical protein
VSDGDRVMQVKAERFDVLRQIYDQTDGDATAFIYIRDAASGYDADTLEKHVGYLTEKGLVRRVAQGVIGITLYGIEETEEVLSSPDQPTPHFAPLVIARNYVNIGGSVSGQIQVDATSSTQSTGISGEDLRGLIAEVRSVLDGLVLEPDEVTELDADLGSVEAQLDSPRPKAGIVREGLASALRILEGVATREVAAGAERLPGVIEQLGHAITQVI